MLARSGSGVRRWCAISRGRCCNSRLFGTAIRTSRFVSADSRNNCIFAATSELADLVAQQLDGTAQPQLVCLFSNAQAPESAAMLADHLRERWPGSALLGLVQPPSEDGDAPFTSILAASLSRGSSAFSFHCAEPTLPPLPSVDEMLQSGATAPQLLLLSACGFRLGQLLSVLDAAFPARARAGGEAPPGSLLLGGGGVHSTGVVGLALSGPLLLDTVTTNGGRPVAMVPVTKTAGSALVELDGRPAAGVLRDCEAQAARGPLDLGLRPVGLSGDVQGTRPSVLQAFPSRQPGRRPPVTGTGGSSQEGSGGDAVDEGDLIGGGGPSGAPGGALAGSAGGGGEDTGDGDGAAGGADAAGSGVLDLSASHAELILEGSGSRPGMAVLVRRDACGADEQLTLALGRYAAALPQAQHEAMPNDETVAAATAVGEATGAVAALEEAARIRTGAGGGSDGWPATTRPGQASTLGSGDAMAPSRTPATSHICAGIIFSAPSRAAPSFFGAGGHEGHAVRRALELPASVPLASVSLPVQIAALPPPPLMRRVRTFAHAHSSVAVFFREGAAAQSSIFIGEEADDPGLGGALAPSTQRLLLRLAALDGEPQSPVSSPTEPPVADDANEQRSPPDTLPASRVGRRRRFEGAVAAESVPTTSADADAAPFVHSPAVVPFATLGAAVFPGTTGRFVLYEPRYRLMLRRALERGEQFATGPDPAVGTIVDITSCKELPDGRYEVVLLGLQRFRTASLAVRPASFGLQLATPIPFDDLVEPPGANDPADVHDVQRARAASAILFKRFTEEGLDVEEEFGPPPPEDDLPALSMWLAAAIPAEPLRKRQWLLLQDARKRLRDQRNWLQQALVAGIL